MEGVNELLHGNCNYNCPISNPSIRSFLYSFNLIYSYCSEVAVKESEFRIVTFFCGTGVMHIHGFFYSVMHPKIARIREFRHQVKNCLPLILCKRREHEVSEILVNPFAFVGRTNADPKSRILDAFDHMLDITQPVVSARTSTRTQPIPSNRKRDIVHHD